MLFSTPANVDESQTGSSGRRARARVFDHIAAQGSAASLTVESIDSHGGAQGQLIVRAVEVEPADLADLAQADKRPYDDAR